MWKKSQIVLRKKLKSLNTYIKKLEKEQSKLRVNRRKQIMKSIVKIIEIQNKTKQKPKVL